MSGRGLPVRVRELLWRWKVALHRRLRPNSKTVYVQTDPDIPSPPKPGDNIFFVTVDEKIKRTIPYRPGSRQHRWRVSYPAPGEWSTWGFCGGRVCKGYSMNKAGQSREWDHVPPLPPVTLTPMQKMFAEDSINYLRGMLGLGKLIGPGRK